MDGNAIAEVLDYISQKLDSNVTPYVAADISSHKSYKRNRILMTYQNELNQENFNLQNQYNAPVNQRLRDIEAGINPNMGNSIAGTMGQPSISNTQDNQLMQAVDIASRNKIAQQQLKIDKQNAETAEMDAITNARKVAQDGEKQNAEIKKIQSETKTQEIENQNKQNVIDSNLQQIAQNIKESQSRQDYNITQTEYIELQKDNYVTYLQAEIDKLIAEGKEAEANATATDELLPYIKRVHGSQAEKNYAEAYKARMDVRIGLMHINNERLAIDNEYKFNIVKYGIDYALADSQIRLNEKLGDLYSANKTEVSAKTIGYLAASIVQLQLAYMNIPQKEAQQVYQNMVIEGEKLSNEAKFTKYQAENYILDRIITTWNKIRSTS